MAHKRMDCAVCGKNVNMKVEYRRQQMFTSNAPRISYYPNVHGPGCEGVAYRYNEHGDYIGRYTFGRFVPVVA